ncbi:hypothetical protein ACFE04_019741 [Oxalis oulophora]
MGARKNNENRCRGGATRWRFLSKGRTCSGLPRSRISHVVRRSNQRLSSLSNREILFPAYPGAAALGHPLLLPIGRAASLLSPLLSFTADLTSRAAPSCSGSSDERSYSDF